MRVLIEPVSDLSPLVSLLIALVWPITIFSILFLFKNTIKTLLRSVAEAKVGDSVFFRFFESKTDLSAVSPRGAEVSPAELAAPPDTERWDKVANLFWLGSDLDWTLQTALRGAPKGNILHGLAQSLHHASQCGLQSTPPCNRLAGIKAQVEQMPESLMDRGWRANFVEQLEVVIQGFSGLAKQQQPDFRAYP